MFIQSFTSSRPLWVEGVETGCECIGYLRRVHGLPASLPLRLEHNGRQLTDLDARLEAESVLHVLPAGGLRGGKGGFGSMLRAIGAQIERTTNHEAMRDLSGRRQRDVNKEARLKEYLSKEGERKAAAEEKKKNKLEKLRRLAAGENKCKHDFADPAYDKARSETEEKVHEAVEAAMGAATAAASTSSSTAEAAKPDLKRPQTSAAGAAATTTTSGPAPPAAKKPKGLWLGAGLDDLEDEDDCDLSDSNDETEQNSGGQSKEVAVI